MDDTEYKIIPNNGHFEVFVGGKFECSADTIPEAVKELEKIMFGKDN